MSTLFGYYGLGALSEAMARSGWLGPAPAQWLPNISFIALASALVLHARGRIAR